LKKDREESETALCNKSATTSCKADGLWEYLCPAESTRGFYDDYDVLDAQRRAAKKYEEIAGTRVDPGTVNVLYL